MQILLRQNILLLGMLCWQSVSVSADEQMPDVSITTQMARTCIEALLAHSDAQPLINQFSGQKEITLLASELLGEIKVLRNRVGGRPVILRSEAQIKKSGITEYITLIDFTRVNDLARVQLGSQSTRMVLSGGFRYINDRWELVSTHFETD